MYINVLQVDIHVVTIHYLPVAGEDSELLASAMTVMLNDWDWVWPDNLTVTSSDLSDSSIEKLEEENSTHVPKNFDIKLETEYHIICLHSTKTINWDDWIKA